MGLQEKILAEIDARGLNQSRLARKAGLGVSMVSDVIAGRRRLYVDQALKLARALGVPLDYLADDEASAPPESLAFTPDEVAVVDLYRSLGLTQREAMSRLVGTARPASVSESQAPADRRPAVGHSVDPESGRRVDPESRRRKSG